MFQPVRGEGVVLAEILNRVSPLTLGRAESDGRRGPHNTAQHLPVESELTTMGKKICTWTRYIWQKKKKKQSNFGLISRRCLDMVTELAAHELVRADREKKVRGGSRTSSNFE